MIFGYANGTDNTIDISPYFMDDNINNENNLITKLIENIHIDNNLFGYQIVEKIKLISIPEQIIFYNDVTPLTNGDILNKEYTFKQNMDINKTNENYSLEYQFIIEEPDSYSDYSKEVINEPSEDSTYIYKKSQFLGRKNTVIFKLCHNYCASCKKFGISNNNQQCLSCLPLYQYDYFSELQSNCVPEGFFIDKENNDNLVECNDTNSKFYFDLEKNKKICFKITYDCPPDYHYFNISTNECQNYTPATTIITTIPTTIITTIITTIPTTIITSIPTTITTTIPTTIITSIPTTIITTIPSTIITTIPTTLISTIPSAIITTIPTTLISTIPSTIITTIPTTLISTIPTSIITSIPTTIITSFPKTILTSIVTTISNNIPTTLVSAIPSTLPISIITTIPKNIISTGFTTIPTSISLTTIPTTVGNRCSYLDLLYSKCSFLNYNNTEIYNIIKEEIINIYPENGESIIILGEDNYAFQLTTGINEINSLNGNYENKYNLSMIDLGKCEELLKQEYNIDSDTDLIFLKFEKLTGIAAEKNVQYEVYEPINKNRLNLSICKNTSIDLYLPIYLSEKIENLYENLKQYGYELFNIKDAFYTDICSKYKSENETDVILSDRKKDYFTNESTCQVNCQYSEYFTETKYLKCECSAVTEEITTVDMDKFNGKMIFESFYEVLKYSNYKVLKCYKLVFNNNVISKNIGSIIVIIYFELYFPFLLLFIIKGISPLKIEEIIQKLEKESKSQVNNDKRKKSNDIYTKLSKVKKNGDKTKISNKNCKDNRYNRKNKTYTKK